MSCGKFWSNPECVHLVSRSRRTRTRPRSVWHRASQTLFIDLENEDEIEDDDDSASVH